MRKSDWCPMNVIFLIFPAMLFGLSAFGYSQSCDLDASVSQLYEETFDRFFYENINTNDFLMCRYSVTGTNANIDVVNCSTNDLLVFHQISRHKWQCGVFQSAYFSSMQQPVGVDCSMWDFNRLPISNNNPRQSFAIQHPPPGKLQNNLRHYN